MPELVEGAKFDEDKVPLDLWSPDALHATGLVLDFGARKYERHNWMKGIKYSRCFAALLRHLWAWWRGEEFDKETGINHLAHAMCCLMFLLHYVWNSDDFKEEFDDRPTYPRVASPRSTSH